MHESSADGTASTFDKPFTFPSGARAGEGLARRLKCRPPVARGLDMTLRGEGAVPVFAWLFVAFELRRALLLEAFFGGGVKRAGAAAARMKKMTTSRP